MPEQQQRAQGQLLVSTKHRDGRTRLADLRQQGCLHACFPSCAADTHESVLVNSAGGVADGDQLGISLHAAAGARMVVSTQAAERIYRARNGAAPSRITTRIEAEAGARMEYLPQETILFQGAALERTLRIDLAPDATYLGIETLIFGRAASGERVTQVHLRDRMSLYRAGRLVLQDQVIVSGNACEILGRTATANGAAVAASITYAADDAGVYLDAVRQLLAAIPANEGAGGASVRDGVLVLRLVMTNGQAARAVNTQCLTALRDGRELPRVWA